MGVGTYIHIPNSVPHRGSRAGWLARLTTTQTLFRKEGKGQNMSQDKVQAEFGPAADPVEEGRRQIGGLSGCQRQHIQQEIGQRSCKH